MLDGRAELVLRSDSDEEPDEIHVVERGSFSYYPAGTFHTIRTGAANATYLMFKWRGAEGERSDPLRRKVVSFSRRFLDASEGGDGGFEVRGVLARWGLAACPVVAPRTWLGGPAWRRLGPLRATELPRAASG